MFKCLHFYTNLITQVKDNVKLKLYTCLNLKLIKKKLLSVISVSNYLLNYFFSFNIKFYSQVQYGRKIPTKVSNGGKLTLFSGYRVEVESELMA